MDQDVMRSIYSGLFVIERHIREVLREINGAPEAGWLFRAQIRDVSEKDVKSLVAISEKILDELHQLQETFEMPRETRSTRWHIINSLNQVWNYLIDLTPERLQRYGKLSVEENKMLAAHIDRMLTLTREMQHYLSDSHQRVTS